MSKALELGNKYKSLLAKYGITTPLRLAHFFSQIAHESGGFKYLAELGGKSYFDKYGSISLLFSWLPIIGDPITFVAGILKYDLKKFIVLVVIAKLSRYLFIAYLVV